LKFFQTFDLKIAVRFVALRSECARGVADVSYQYEVPTTFGVLTTSNMEQTIGRAGGYKGNKGEEATLAMIEMLYLLDQI
jgi:6,7-dimethyl-8-ribityllumazine synthase